MEINWQLFHPLRFQAFCRDLMKRHLGVEQVEAFAPGPDGGIDLRAHDGTTIIQCKHYSGEKRHLFRALKEEALKERVKTAKRYIVLTTRRLSPADKDIIKDIFPNVHSTEDVLGGDDLEGIVATYPDIRKLYPQLWLGDEDRLRQLFRDELDKSTDLITQCEWEKIIETLQYVAKPPLADEAASILQEHHALIITGKPGIGKTTLAYYLIWLIVQKLEYEFIYVSSNIETAFQKFDEKKKQIFLYDDFLGANFLKSGLSKNEDKRIPHFIRKVHKAANKLVIFTTREFIFQQALAQYENLREAQIDPAKLLLQIKTDDIQYKAEILYNHLWFQKIPFKHIECLFFDKDGEKWTSDCYLRQIIHHPSFNPRIIATALSKEQKRRKDEEFPEYVIRTINDPYSLYSTAFSQQLRKLEKLVLLVLGLFPKWATPEQLEQAVMQQCVDKELSYNETFEEALGVLMGDFITSYDVGFFSTPYIIINFVNPGVRDFINSFYTRDIAVLKALIKNIAFPEQLISILQTIKETNEPVLFQIKREAASSGIRMLTHAVENNALNSNHILLAASISSFLKGSETNIIKRIIVLDAENYFASLNDSSIESYISILSNYEDFTNTDRENFICAAFESFDSTEVFCIFNKQNSLRDIAKRSYFIKQSASEWKNNYLARLEEFNEIADLEDEIANISALIETYPNGISDIDFREIKYEIESLISILGDNRDDSEDNNETGWSDFTSSISSSGGSSYSLNNPATAERSSPDIPPYLAIFQTLNQS